MTRRAKHNDDQQNMNTLALSPLRTVDAGAEHSVQWHFAVVAACADIAQHIHSPLTLSIITESCKVMMPCPGAKQFWNERSKTKQTTAADGTASRPNKRASSVA